MLPTVERLNSCARVLLPAALLFVAAAALPARAQIGRDPQNPQPPIRRGPLPPITTHPLPPNVGNPSPSPGGNSPTMKKPEPTALPPSRPRRSYDAKRDVTYVNVDITLLAHKSVKDSKGAKDSRGVPRFEGREVVLTFQLAYQGRQTYDLVSAFLIVESTAATGEPDKLSAAPQLAINADPYEYTYERLDYQTEQIAAFGSVTQPLRKEITAFKLPTEDLPQITNAGRLVVKIGAETFTVKSPQLSELRRTLAAGPDN